MGEPTRIYDVRDLRPPRSLDDRREGPRRKEEQHLHVATEILVQLACSTVDRMLDPASTDDESFEALLALHRAVDTYRTCAEALLGPPSVTVPRETRRRSTD